MSDRRNKIGVTNKMVAYIAAGLVHLVIIGVLVFNFTVSNDVEKVDAFDAEKIDTVKASVIDDRKLEEQMEAIKEKDRKKAEQERRERERLEQLKRDAETEKQRIEDLKKQQKEEQAKAEQLEKEREAIALQRKKELEEEEKRKKALEEKKKREQAAREKREREAREKKQAEERRQREIEEADRKRLADMLEAEERAAKQKEAERRAGERTTTVVNQFFARIQQKVEAKRTISPDFETWRKSVVQITVSPSGQVRSVRTIESSGSAAYDRAAEAGVYAASPVPMPDANEFPDAVDRLLTFELVMKHPNAR